MSSKVGGSKVGGASVGLEMGKRPSSGGGGDAKKTKAAKALAGPSSASDSTHDGSTGPVQLLKAGRF